MEDALEIARLAGVKQLALFHYDPHHSDVVVEEQLMLAKDLSKQDSFSVIAAAEGMQLKVGQI